MSQNLIKKFLEYRRTFDISSYLFRLKKSGIFVLTWEDKNYPKRLKEIGSSPPVIYVLSRKYLASSIGEIWEKRGMAVVGTRKISGYGRRTTEMLVSDLVDVGLVIVSGLMYGVDEVAHRAAIKSGGETIGVWAGGIDTVFNCGRKTLAEEVVKHGAVISEFPLGMNPSKGTFPARNRIVSGLSLGVLVTEGAQDSGSLITARYAAEQGREVFAVPGPITSSLSAAPSQLIKSGAKLVSNADDILEELGISGRSACRQTGSGKSGVSKEKIEDLSREERKIWGFLENQGMHIDKIVRKTGLTSSKVGSLLSLMEIKGLVENFGQSVYGRKI